jgi:hemin uptake protein HemP
MPADAQPPSYPDKVEPVRSEDLFAGRSELVIEHHGVFYRLRITRQDKLILTK